MAWEEVALIRPGPLARVHGWQERLERSNHVLQLMSFKRRLRDVSQDFVQVGGRRFVFARQCCEDFRIDALLASINAQEGVRRHVFNRRRKEDQRSEKLLGQWRLRLPEPAYQQKCAEDECLLCLVKLGRLLHLQRQFAIQRDEIQVAW